MKYDPKLTRYAIKYLYKDKLTGTLFGPSREFLYQIGEWYTTDGKIECCSNGFHVPSYFDIYLANWTWHDEYVKHNDDDINDLVIVLVEVGGYLDLGPNGNDSDKISFKRIRIVKELSDQSVDDSIRTIVEKLNKHYRTIYHKNFEKYIFTNRQLNSYLIK